MKQFLIISSFFLVLISASMVGYHVVSANEKVEEVKDQITIQTEKEVYLTPYGYTLENPNIILNPYGTTPLSAMILFETTEPEEVTITVLGQEETTFTNTFKSTTNHIIPIYGLYPNTENQIKVECGTKTQIYTIQTDPLPTDLDTSTKTNTNEGLTLYQSSNYIYGLDKNQEVRWLYENNTSKYPYLLENGNILIYNTSSNSGSISNSLLEIDLTGKIYKQYNLDNEYTGLIIEKENSLFIVTKNLIELEKQTGTILNNYSLNNTYTSIFLDESKENIILQNDQEEQIINLKNSKQTTQTITSEIFKTDLTLNPYSTNSNYKISKGTKFQNLTETAQSDKNIFLIGYKNPDKTYNKYNIKIHQTTDNIQISGNFQKKDTIYIILDKFLDKRIYELTENYITINKTGLSGKYSVYIKINDKIYKTNTYVNFKEN